MTDWIDVLETGMYRVIFPCLHYVIRIENRPEGQPIPLVVGQQVQALACPDCSTALVLEQVLPSPLKLVGTVEAVPEDQVASVVLKAMAGEDIWGK